ncbi:hypothetical protein [Solimonas soli]|uniref:hypothetical protein n=1 Tax=Solimonas soli TaxID=413479 RepID=UPI0012FC7B3E|nr:hypothetical protein [Solimonas soli]
MTACSRPCSSRRTRPRSRRSHDIDESQLPEAAATATVEYSTVNYEDGLDFPASVVVDVNA